jgi:hypothetical protein
MSILMANANADPSGCRYEGAQPNALVTASAVQPQGAHGVPAALHIGVMNRVETADVGNHDVGVPFDEVTERRRIAVVDDGWTREGGYHRSP